MNDSTMPTLGEDGKIVEGVVTTLNEDGSTNISPMGPIVDHNFTRILFRPFQTSTTYKNLFLRRQGVFHVTDDVGLIAKAAVGQLTPLPRLVAAKEISGMALADACRRYEFEVESIDDSQQRSLITARTIAVERIRDFLGFNRAQAAVIEAAILATRIHLIPAEELSAELERLKSPVSKTGGKAELSAFEFVCDYVNSELASCNSTT